MEYELKLFNTPLLRFSANPESANPAYEILWVNKCKTHLLPWGFECTSQGIESWVRRRVAPKNRAFISTFLARSGLSANRPLGIIGVCKGLSLGDSYWVSTRDSQEMFEAVNLFDNPLSRLLAQIAFTGYGSSPKVGFSSSPEFTTNGNLAKCWRRINGSIYLYKSGTTGAANAGMEPYSEYYATNVAKTMGVQAVEYSLHAWKGIVCSACKLFTSKEVAFVPIANIVTEGGFEAVGAYYQQLGEPFAQAFSDMLAFDALIANTDRHFNNFGVLVNSRTNEIIAPAPLFDHGNSLFYQAFGNDWENEHSLGAYAETLMPCAYDNFFETAKTYMKHTTRNKVRSMLQFKFSYGPRRAFDQHRLRLIQQEIQNRARVLLE